MSNICQAFKSLFPNGKAFKYAQGTDADKFQKALCHEPERIKAYFDNVKYSGIPGQIPDDFLSDWEDFLGIKKNTTLTSAQRQERIISRFISVGGQGKDYIKSVLNASGFDVCVYENFPEDGQRAYTTLLGDCYLGDTLLGDFSDRIDPRTLTNGTLIAGSPDYSLQRVYTACLGDIWLGDALLGSMGQFNGDVIIETEYTIPSNADRFIFFWFIAGCKGIYDFVDIPKERKNDFIELILQIKPIHTWAIAQINWI